MNHSQTRNNVSVSDSSMPPVLFVVGTAGAGKSTLVTAFQRWTRFLEVECLTINLDPGAERQVELFAFREASSHMVEVLGQGQAALIFLFDPMLSQSASGFVSQMLLSNIVHFRLGLPTANFLSKSDLLPPEDLDRVLGWGEDLDMLESALFEEAGGQRTEFAIGQLRMMQNAQIQPGLIPLSSEQEEGLADILSFAQSIFGGMADTRDGFAGDIEGERN